MIYLKEHNLGRSRSLENDSRLYEKELIYFILLGFAEPFSLSHTWLHCLSTDDSAEISRTFVPSTFHKRTEKKIIIEIPIQTFLHLIRKNAQKQLHFWVSNFKSIRKTVFCFPTSNSWYLKGARRQDCSQKPASKAVLTPHVPIASKH